MAGPQSKPTGLPTLEDVAERAGVSTATVSRCLNSPEQVVEKTRARVMDAVRALGYAPNFGARSLASRRTNTIGAIIPTLDNAIFAAALQAFQKTLEDRGFTLLVASSDYDPKTESEQIQSLIARGADGLLLIGHERDPANYAFLDGRGVPYLISWAHDPAEGRLSIGFDNKRAMAQLARAVVEAGHRRIAMISAHRAGNDRARARADGVLQAAKKAGIAKDDVAIIETTYSFESGAKAARDLLSRAVPPTAILCGNDVLAVGALTAAQEMGVSVPRDLSVTGFDDIELAAYAYPKLTTVHVPHRKMGRQAAHMLADMLDGKPTDTSVVLQTRIVMRDTLGPPAGD